VYRRTLETCIERKVSDLGRMAPGKSLLPQLKSADDGLIVRINEQASGKKPVQRHSYLFKISSLENSNSRGIRSVLPYFVR
jgi:hypothetical protein